MYSAYLLPADQFSVKANELHTTKGFILCALDVIHLHKEVLDVREHKFELDCLIIQAYVEQLISELLLKATQWLVSPLPARQIRGSQLVTIMSEADLDKHPEYKVYRHLLRYFTGDTPLLRLHLLALELTVAELRSIRRMSGKATVAETILENFWTHPVNEVEKAAWAV